MIGLRGIPASWGGVERHVEELGARLADRGHEVTVYNRAGYAEAGRTTHRGVRLVEQWAPQGRGLEALLHSTLSAARALPERYDVVHFHAVGPGLAAPIPRYLSRAAVVQTIHGLDAARDKWGRGAQALLTAGTWLSARLPDRTVAVSRELERHYADVYGSRACYVPNGVVPAKRVGEDVLRARFGLEPGSYVLFVGRLVPEKSPDLLIKAFARLETDKRLVVVGGSSDTDTFTGEIRALAALDPRVLLPGYVFGDDLAALYGHAEVFALPSLLEGLPLTLLEACSYALPVVASAIPPHLEVIGAPGPGARTAPPGDVDALTAALQLALADGELERAGARSLSARVLAHYDWDHATDLLEGVYREAVEVAAHRRVSRRPDPAPAVTRVLDLTTLPPAPRRESSPAHLATGGPTISLDRPRPAEPRDHDATRDAVVRGGG